MANEDIPEPLSVEQLSEYNSLQQRTRQARLALTTSSVNAMTAPMAANASTGSSHKQKLEEKRNALQLDKSCIISKKDSSSSDKKDDLVTIVTITPQNNNDNSDMIENQNNTNHDMTQSGGGSREEIEILAHL